MNKRIEAAKQAHEDAAKAMMQAIQKEYPIGSVVNVTLGRATFDARVIRHSNSWWYNPGEITGENIKTMKRRTFSPEHINE